MHELETLYTPRTMLAALEQKPAPSSFLRDMFVRSTEEHDTDTIEIDIEKGGQTLAVYVARGGDAHRVALGGYSTNIHVIPYVSEEVRFTPKDLKVRLAGETAYTAGAKKRLNKKVGKGLKVLRDRFKCLEEYQLSQALQTGTAVIAGEGVNYTVDFQMDATHKTVNTGVDAWGLTTASIKGDIREDSLKAGRAGAPAPTVLILGFNAAIDFSEDTDIKSDLDIKDYNVGHIDFKQLNENKATYIGHFKGVGYALEVYSYHDQYEDENGDMQYYLDPDVYVMGSTSARVEAHYGMIENMNHGSHIGREFPDFVVDRKGKHADLTLESAPLIAPHQIDAFVTRRVK